MAVGLIDQKNAVVRVSVAPEALLKIRTACKADKQMAERDRVRGSVYSCASDHIPCLVSVDHLACFFYICENNQ